MRKFKGSATIFNAQAMHTHLSNYIYLSIYPTHAYIHTLNDSIRFVMHSCIYHGGYAHTYILSVQAYNHFDLNVKYGSEAKKTERVEPVQMRSK